MRKVLVRSGRGAAVLLGTALTALPGVASAEPLDLESCVRLALRNNVAVAQADAALDRAEADGLGAWSGFLPSARVSASWNKPEEAVEIFQAGTLRFFDESYRANFQASLPLFDGLGNIQSWRQASQGKKQAARSREATLQDVVLETERRFFEVGRQEALLDVQQEAVRLSQEQLKKTEAMKELGAATQADVYKAEVDHSNNRLSELRTERDLQVAEASLAEYLGLDPGQELDLAETDLTSVGSWNLDEATRTALEDHPEVLASEAGLSAARSGIGAARSALWPSLSLFYNSNYFNFEFGDFDDEHIEWSYGASVNFTIFDGLLTKASIRRAQASALEGRRSLEAKKLEVQRGVRTAWLDLEIARQSIEVAESAVRSSEEDLRLAQERYKIGEGTILDVIDAQVNLTRSKTDLVAATYDARLAVSALRNAIGVMPVPEPVE
jgi:TolC family type I secretion outer membrane protein